ncbi:uncharacterized protein LOC124921045 [Impatiens glandulifera]|uniref:uncharacterized protein LOC124921045 n=1 Tax=Impatiens glandulifera TaxID=253017 RepID=UPI001FB1760D|nr:uncharacterized protein LOC124921045 [Impatiens glandulifera]
MAAASSFLTISFLLLITSHHTNALKSPFHARDILPLLPRQISWPILKSIGSPVDLLPAFVGSASATYNTSLYWKGTCFDKNKAWIEFHNKTNSEFGGGTLHIEVDHASSWTCMDLYIFATPYRVTWDYYFRSRDHTMEFMEWEGKAEYEYVKRKGISIFLMQAGMLGTLKALWNVFPLFTNTGWGENSNIDFLENHMGASFEIRPKPWSAEINTDDIQSGDLIVISKLRGRWGGFETLEKWVTGAYAGHSVVCLRDLEGKLWIGESGHDHDEGPETIEILTWDDWWISVTTEKSDPHVALLPLSSSVRAKFNNTAAWQSALTMSGSLYGYHNMIFSWIDTVSNNYPPPLDAHVIASGMTVWTRLQPDYAANLWNEALNLRLGTKDLDLPHIITEAVKRGSSFDELLAIPEQDVWIYSDGKSVSCIAFILEIYKAAGLFGQLSRSIQVTEFTIKDAYSLDFFEKNSSMLPKWCNDGDTVKMMFCQILGQYRMELPGYNSMPPYAHMNERCPSLPPTYYKPTGC